MFKKILLFSTITSCFIQLSAQTGPGGVGATNGATNLRIWLDANKGVSLTGASVTSWADQSGYGNNAIPPAAVNRPTYTASGVNNFPIITFDGTNSYLDAGSNASLNASTWSIVIVTKVNVLKDYNAFFIKGNDGAENYEFLTYGDAHVHHPVLWTNGTRTFLNSATGAMSTTTYNVYQYDYDGTTRTQYNDLTTVVTDAPGLAPQTNNLSLLIGNELATTGRLLNGSIAEVMMFNSKINMAQRIIVENYLSAKYGTALSASDVYTNDNVLNGNYDYNVAGVGQASDGTQQLDSRGTGIVEVNNVSGLANNRFFTWGDDNGGLAANNSADIPSPVQARSVRVWRANNSGITSEDISFDLSGLGSITASDLRLLIDKNGSGTFSDETSAGGGVLSGFTLVSGSTYKLSGVNIADGQRFTIGTINQAVTPLPIELLDFTAVPSGNKVDLNWSTASEKNNDFFTVEKTKDALNYDFVATVKGAGNSTSVLDYSSADNDPYEGVSYYRLKQTDYNGEYTYSSLKMVDFTAMPEFSFNVYPNPSEGDNINISITADKGEEVLVVVYDITGKESYSKVVITENNGDSIYAIDPSNKLAPGVYIITATSQQSIFSKKLIVK